MTDDLPPRRADPNQLEMALLNLGVNARDAMPDGGTPRIAAGRAVDGGAAAGLAPGRYVRLSVADTGVGMDEETLARAVEPFFSTKGVGRGTGLGLSMVHGLAAQLGGALSISEPRRAWAPTPLSGFRSRRGRGRPVPQAARNGGGAGTDGGTVLLVDDEALVRASTADMLADLGYAVVEAGSARRRAGAAARGAAPRPRRHRPSDARA